MLTSIVGNVFQFKAQSSASGRPASSSRLPQDIQGPPHGIQVERDKLNKYGRPLLGCTIKPKLGLSAKNYGRAVYECLRWSRLHEDDGSQPFMLARSLPVRRRCNPQAETGEIKGHYLNVTAPTCERDDEAGRVCEISEYAHHHARLPHGWLHRQHHPGSLVP